MSQYNQVIKLKGVVAGFKTATAEVPVLKNVSGTVRSSEMVSVIGANGSGKSTILKTIAGLIPVLGGDIELFGQNFRDFSRINLARNISFVAAGSTMPYNMSVEELVALGRFPHTNWIGRLTPADREAIAGSIHSVGMYQLRERSMRHLSDGERQRVMIARALAQDTAIIVLDEPTAFLDLPNRFELVNLIRKLAEQKSKAVLLSTHDLGIAIRESDKIWLLHDHGLSEGSPEDLIMSGHFMNLFEGSGLNFIEEEGSFSYPVMPRFSITLDSVPSLAMLTRQALKRLGAELNESSPDHKITATEIEGKPTWTYSGTFGNQDFNSLYDLGWFVRMNLQSI